MNLAEEIDHYLAGLRESNRASNDAVVTSKAQEQSKCDITFDYSKSGFHGRCELHRHPLPAGHPQKLASCDDSINFGEKAVERSQALAPMEVAARPITSMTAAASNVEKSTHNAIIPSGFSEKESQDRVSNHASGPPPQLETRALVPLQPHGVNCFRNQIVRCIEGLVSYHEEDARVDGDVSFEEGSAIDVAADAELDLIREYASSDPSEAHCSGEIVSGAENYNVLTNEEDCHATQPSSKAEEEE